MSKAKLFYRLDIKLTVAVSVVFVIWLASILTGLHLLRVEREAKETDIERRRLSDRIERDKSDLLSDILLNHTESLILSVKHLQSDLDLAWVELRTRDNQIYTAGDRSSVRGKSSTVINQDYPIVFEGTAFGQLRVIKEIHKPKSDFTGIEFLLGSLFVLLLVFLIMRQFVRKEIVQPLSFLITHFGSNQEETAEGVIKTGSYEIDELGKLLQKMRVSIQDLQGRNLEQERKVIIANLASQVVHDIRSPLAALDVAVSTIGADIPEGARLMLRGAAGRIRDIANELIKEYRPSPQGPPGSVGPQDTAALHLISSLVEEIVSEKRLQLSARMGVEVEAQLGRETYGLFAKVQGAELKRVVSNLINNSVEALADRGKVTLRLAADGAQVVLSIADNGKGIPAEILSRLGERGFTYGKEGGSGLGIHHAYAAVERWGGRLDIRSSRGLGTTVEIRLPLASPPAWFVDRIVLASGAIVVVLDDDRAIHATWDRLLAPFAELQLTVLHFTEAQALRAWLPEHRDVHFLGLLDYELLRQDTTGLDVVEQEGIADRAILVTSRYSEPAIVERAARLGLKIIPKQLVGVVPIVGVPLEKASPLAVPEEKAALSPGARVLVVDDDELVAGAWKQQGQRLGIAELRIFRSMEACESVGLNYEAFDLAFVDLKIKDTSWQVDVTIRHLKERGVKQVVIATGLTDAESDPRCQEADFIVNDKVPQDLDRYLKAALYRGLHK